MGEVPQKAKGGKKNRKVGRKKIWCQSYRARHQREHNKAIRLKKHIAKWPADACATEALKRVYTMIRPQAA